jgi:hypothetical protein
MNNINIRVFEEENKKGSWNAVATGLEKYGTGNSPSEALTNFLLQSYIYGLYLLDQEKLTKYEESQFKKLLRFKFLDLKDNWQYSFLQLHTMSYNNDFESLGNLHEIRDIDKFLIKAYEKIKSLWMTYAKISRGFAELLCKDNNGVLADNENILGFLKYSSFANNYRDLSICFEQQIRDLVNKNENCLEGEN